MRAYLTAYLAEIEKLLSDSAADTDYDAVMRRHLQMIGFMQHERLIHFLVTMLFALGFFLVLGFFLMTEQIMLVPLMVLILVLLVPYIMHYYFLENSVQKMYKLYDEINSRKAGAQPSGDAGGLKGGG